MPPNPPPQLGAHRRKHPTRHAAREYELAEATLGRQHPLVAVLRSTLTATEQALTVAAVQAADLILLLKNAPLAIPLAIAAAALQSAVGLRIAYLRTRKRAAGRQLIIDGREQLPLPTVNRELRRLGDARYQVALAKSIDELTNEAAHPRLSPPCPRPIYHLDVVQAVAAQLHEIARLLHRGDTPARGVAHVESLMTSCTSPLYGTEVDPLREELVRARYFLAAHN